MGDSKFPPGKTRLALAITSLSTEAITTPFFKGELKLREREEGTIHQAVEILRKTLCDAGYEKWIVSYGDGMVIINEPGDDPKKSREIKFLIDLECQVEELEIREYGFMRSPLNQMRFKDTEPAVFFLSIEIARYIGKAFCTPGSDLVYFIDTELEATQFDVCLLCIGIMTESNLKKWYTGTSNYCVTLKNPDVKDDKVRRIFFRMKDEIADRDVEKMKNETYSIPLCLCEHTSLSKIIRQIVHETIEKPGVKSFIQCRNDEGKALLFLYKKEIEEMGLGSWIESWTKTKIYLKDPDKKESERGVIMFSDSILGVVREEKN